MDFIQWNLLSVFFVADTRLGIGNVIEKRTGPWPQVVDILVEKRAKNESMNE